MNKDQIVGTAKDVAGNIQKNVGDLFDSNEQVAKGIQKQAEGKIQKQFGDTRDAIENPKTPRDL